MSLFLFQAPKTRSSKQETINAPKNFRKSLLYFKEKMYLCAPEKHKGLL